MRAIWNPSAQLYDLTLENRFVSSLQEMTTGILYDPTAPLITQEGKRHFEQPGVWEHRLTSLAFLILYLVTLTGMIYICSKVLTL